MDREKLAVIRLGTAALKWVDSQEHPAPLMGDSADGTAGDER
jgi:hypothetical protein